MRKKQKIKKKADNRKSGTKLQMAEKQKCRL